MGVFYFRPKAKCRNEYPYGFTFYFHAPKFGSMEGMEIEKKDYATIQLKPRGPVTITGSFEIILEDGTGALGSGAAAGVVACAGTGVGVASFFS